MAINVLLFKNSAAVLLLIAVFFTFPVWAKKGQIYSCQQTDGTIVLQDRRCQVTQLQQVKTKTTKPKSLSQSKVITKPVSKSQIIVKPNKLNKNNQASTNSKNQQPSRSPYFTFGWDQFIPKNWQIHQSKADLTDYWLLSKTQFKSVAEFDDGVKLQVYADTLRNHQQAAFAQALILYHRIRDNNNFELIDSQFKAHSNYKVFNIKYLQPKNKVTLTEFYIDEVNNDLFVLTIQSRPSVWQLNWDMAESIVANL